MKNLAAAAAAAAGLACAAVADVMPGTQDEGLFPFTFTTPAHHTVVDCSDWFAAPAGADGFVRAEGERFVTDRGEVFLNGVNLTGAACFPTHEEAEELAKRLGRLGFNAVRLHYADCVGLTNIRFRAQVGLIRRGERPGDPGPAAQAPPAPAGASPAGTCRDSGSRPPRGPPGWCPDPPGDAHQRS